MRAQFTHVIDVGPTILEAAGIPEPRTVDGIEQEPMDGTSFLYTLDDADAPERHTTQYFEMFGSRGMYKDGWWAASRPDRLPWDLSPETLAQFGPDADWDPDRDVGWELYNLRDDFSQAQERRRRPPRQGHRAAGAVVERGGAQPRAAADGRVLGHVRHPAAACPPRPASTFAGDVQNIQWGMIPRIYGRSYSIEGRPRGAREAAPRA